MGGYIMSSFFTTTEENMLPEKEQEIKSYDDLSRRDVRSLVFHLLYAAEAFDYQESLQSLVDNFNRGFDLDIPFDSELVTVASAIINSREELQTMYEPYLSNWRVERVSVCTKLILFFGIWELKNTTTDTRIVINEAIELAKCFAEEDSYRFVNGILDSIAKDLRKE
jgi:N utilization substance protein B